MATKSIPSTRPEVGLKYPFLMKWEDEFDHPKSMGLFLEHWEIPFFFAIVFYLPTLYIGQKIMKNREPLNVKYPMMLWNAGLAIFSIVGFTRVLPEFVYAVSNGLHYSICDNSYRFERPCILWNYLFVLSKTVELGDTFFLVLRKQKLIFLHVYHHASVLIFSWFIYRDVFAASRWFSTMNLGVHSIMYTYYVLKALPNIIKIPKWVSMLITIMQTTQMIIGAFIVSASYYTKLSGKRCDTTHSLSIAGLIIYLSYLFLFSQFFYRAYCSPKPPRDVSKADKKRV